MRTHNICFYKKVNKKYTGCNKTAEFQECALLGVCAVIRSNTVYPFLLGGDRFKEHVVTVFNQNFWIFIAKQTV